MFLFGASGDLATRYVLPALAKLHEANLLPENFEATGFARRDWDDDAFREFAGEHLDEYAEDVDGDARRGLLESLRFSGADITDKAAMDDALGGSEEPVLAYLSLPPGIFPSVVEALSGMPKGSRIVVEKPFGENLSSARELNELLHKHFDEERVFRADHFLGMKTLRDVLALRFANRVFEAAWSRDHIERVEIIWDETLALEGRASYYDGAGAMKDVIQNHLLQTMCMISMEEPSSVEDVREEKMNLLRAIRKPSPEEAGENTVRARYSSREIGGREIPAYSEEEGVDASQNTETFAEITLHIDNERWAGVPFLLRAGKAMAEDRQEIRIHFKASRSPLFEGGEPNTLTLPFDGGEAGLSMNAAADGDIGGLAEARLAAEFETQKLPAYSMLLLRALRGETTFFVRGDEAEESWRVVEPIMDAWKENLPPLREYPAGSEGPS
ncbi:MAG: glucose-6-phosphate dehydrogenase [Rubrobacter sp.]|nr:glucose-6-phosphate dehydrogenase [Rubrobacter sp.]